MTSGEHRRSSARRRRSARSPVCYLPCSLLAPTAPAPPRKRGARLGVGEVALIDGGHAAARPRCGSARQAARKRTSQLVLAGQRPRWAADGRRLCRAAAPRPPPAARQRRPEQMRGRSPERRSCRPRSAPPRPAPAGSAAWARTSLSRVKARVRCSGLARSCAESTERTWNCSSVCALAASCAELVAARARRARSRPGPGRRARAPRAG